MATQDKAPRAGTTDEYGEQSAVERIRHYRTAFLAQEIYPLSVVWHSDLCGVASSAFDTR